MARTRYDSLTTPAAGFPDTILAARGFLDFLFDLADRDAVATVTDETGTVPASGLMTLDHVPADPAAVIIATTPAASVSEYTSTTSTGTLSAGQVRIDYKFRDRLDFPAADVGTPLYFTYTTRGSGLGAALFAELFAEIRAAQEYLTGTSGLNALSAVAGENLTDVFVYLSTADGKFYTADPTDPAKFAVAYVSGTVLATATATGYVEKLLTLDPSPPGQKQIFVGRGGKPTYHGDNSAANLLNGDTVQPAGIVTAGTFRLNLAQPTLWEMFT